MTLRLHDSTQQPLPGRRGGSAMGWRSHQVRGASTGLQAIGVLALGAAAVGALAIGALAIGKLAVGRARVRRLDIDELVIRKLRVTEELQLPPPPAQRRMSRLA